MSKVGGKCGYFRVFGLCASVWFYVKYILTLNIYKLYCKFFRLNEDMERENIVKVPHLYKININMLIIHCYCSRILFVRDFQNV